jgi:uncharacterized delta-60 repeat protein
VLDTSFGAEGWTTASVGFRAQVEAAALDPAGRILVGGGIVPESGGGVPPFLARFTAAGVLDTTFRGGGVVLPASGEMESPVSDIVAASDGTYVIGTRGAERGVFRYTSSGTRLARSWYLRGGAIHLDLRPDGGILVATMADTSAQAGMTTSYDFFVAGLRSDLSLDTTFGDNGCVYADTGTFDAPGSVVTQPDGKILMVGESDGYLALIRLRTWSASAPPPPTNPYSPAPATLPPPPSVSGSRYGYWMLGRTGEVYAFGNARSYGNARVGATAAVDIEPTGSGNGYWVVDEIGRVFAIGDAASKGSAPPGGLAAGEKVTSISSTPSGYGYWLFTNRGRVVSIGNAPFLGDMRGTPLNGSVLDSIPTPSGEGYFMVASDGGIFAFGDAVFRGSMGGKPLNAPVQSLVPDPDGEGYWLVASDGGIFAFGAGFHGSMGDRHLNKAITGMVAYGTGYLMVAEDGGIFSFSDKPSVGSLGATPPANPIVSVAALEP